MIRPAIWVLEQEYEYAKKYFSWGPGGPLAKPAATAALIVLGIVQSAAISGMPYASLIQAHGFVEDYVWMRTAPQHRIKGFRIKSPGFKAVPYGWSVSRKAAFRLGAAKVAARFIPYVGWGLLAYDLYTVGKWAHGKIKD